MSLGDASPRRDGKPRLIERLRSLLRIGGASTRDDIEDALEAPAGEGEFSPKERTMLKNVLGLHEIRIADIMVPRADIVAVGIDAQLGDVLSLFRTAGHSRLPVHGETLDDPRGMVHIRDFLDYIAGAVQTRAATRGEGAQARLVGRLVGAIDVSQPLETAKILRPVLFVPPSMPAIDLLVKMQATRTHMALVIDEYGGTDGLVSIEDIVEVIVGDIEDEHDEAESPDIEKQADGAFVADARAGLEDAAAATGLDFSTVEDAEDIDTLGGLITTIAGRVPVRGEIITGPGCEFEILDADPRRLKRLKITLRPAAGETGAAEGAGGSDKRNEKG